MSTILIGAGQWLRYLVGALEVAGGVGLLILALAGLASGVGGIADRCCHHRSVRARAEPLAAARPSRRGGRDRKGPVVAHRGRRRHAAQALRQTSGTEM